MDSDLDSDLIIDGGLKNKTAAFRTVVGCPECRCFIHLLISERSALPRLEGAEIHLDY
ncbi:hypothetical protein [Paenibacillus yonginensis]|uniref:hypothetical protein n=1 Tax=Paenibacillus yonginensis TaxID=1462996 RepID=UPI0014720775|nr:hypothetical protein [Paenibacillus yonginensis]